jgi:osmotically inducible protein OsmC
MRGRGRDRANRLSLPTWSTAADSIGKGTEGKTSPEELLAAAHAGCFAMSLAGELRRDDAHIDVTANVVMDEVEGKGHQIVESQLTVRVAASGVERGAEFDRIVRAAHEGCPFSQLIEASAKVTIDAEGGQWPPQCSGPGRATDERQRREDCAPSGAFGPLQVTGQRARDSNARRSPIARSRARDVLRWRCHGSRSRAGARAPADVRRR